MATKALVIGPGRVGSEVARQAQELGWEVGLLGSKTFSAPGIFHNWDSVVSMRDRIDQVSRHLDFYPDVAFVTTPPFGDEGKKEYEILRALAWAHLPTVICTKEMFAYRPEDFNTQALPYFHRKFACNASVGGEVGILQILKERRVGERPIVFDIAPNASTNSILSMLSSYSMESACEKAEKDGLLEPGKGPLLSKLDRECLDGTYKACALFNRLDLGRGIYLTPQMLNRSALTQEELDQLPKGLPRRLVVSFSNKSSKSSPSPGWASFYAEVAGWTISGGLKPIDISDRWIPNGPSAAVRIFESHEVPFVASGRGAGAEATARRMILDALNMGIS